VTKTRHRQGIWPVKTERWYVQISLDLALLTSPVVIIVTSIISCYSKIQDDLILFAVLPRLSWKLGIKMCVCVCVCVCLCVCMYVHVANKCSVNTIVSWW